jgi:hypothetical protein
MSCPKALAGMAPVAPQVRKTAYFWNGLAGLAFAVLCAICFALIYLYGDSRIDGLALFDLVVLGLAALRVIHLITYDKIFDVVRAAVMDSDRGRLRKAERGWRRAVCELMDCLWCAGLWSALIVVTMYLLGSWGRLAVFILAVAGLGSLLQVISKAIAKD